MYLYLVLVLTCLNQVINEEWNILKKQMIQQANVFIIHWTMVMCHLFPRKLKNESENQIISTVCDIR